MSDIDTDHTRTAEEIRAKITPNRRRWVWAIVVVTLMSLGVAGYMQWRESKSVKPTYVTAAADRGNISLSVATSGTLEPVTRISVNSEIVGTVTKVLVDTNDRVEAGQPLIELDTRTLDNERDLAKAALDVARANVARGEAVLAEARQLEARMKSLLEKGTTAVSSVDEARGRRKRAEADLRAAKAEVRRAQVSLRGIEQQRGLGTITSPISGIILERAVEPGDTVTSSHAAIPLLVLAEDLKSMELRVQINESDIGLIDEGQGANFKVDAFPGEAFEAEVREVGYSPTTVDNVVTYRVVLEVTNNQTQLRPGMTATADISTGLREDVLRVPVEALWFRPKEEDEGLFKIRNSRLPQGRPTQQKRGSSVYVMRKGGELERVLLRLGRSDGEFIEVLDGALEVGDEVITAQKAAKKAS